MAGRIGKAIFAEPMTPEEPEGLPGLYRPAGGVDRARLRSLAGHRAPRGKGWFAAAVEEALQHPRQLRTAHQEPAASPRRRIRPARPAPPPTREYPWRWSGGRSHRRS